ncbi:MAG: ribonuclease III [Acidimicrobiia bacterium]|nr:ribonuclease III [Acidimicrobiia bacterium]
MASNDRPADLAIVEQMIGYMFEDPSLLLTALTHSSFVAENPGTESYERLELLGDAVLGLFATARLFNDMSDEPEGVITKARATVVNEATLAEVARSLDLGAHVRLGVGEERSGGADRDGLLCDVMEAVLGAVFVDGGADAARDQVDRHLGDRIDGASQLDDATDARSRLQEALARTDRRVSFEYRRTGPDHAVIFEAQAVVAGEVVGEGSGSSKKAAAVAASADALERNTFV